MVGGDFRGGLYVRDGICRPVFHVTVAQKQQGDHNKRKVDQIFFQHWISSRRVFIIYMKKHENSCAEKFYKKSG